MRRRWTRGKGTAASAVAIGVSLTLLLAACGSEPETPTAATTDESTEDQAEEEPEPEPDAAGGEKGTIAFSYGNESAGIYPIVATPAKLEAERLGYRFIEGAANGDCDKQVQDIENFVTQGVDAIVFLPLCGQEPYQNVVNQAKAAGIVVVGYSQDIPGGDAAIVYDNIGGAQKLAAEALRWLEEDFTGNRDEFSWALFTFDQCGAPCTQRTDPIREIIVEATGVEPLEAECVAEDCGLETVETFLQRNPNLNMVIGINDAGALGAHQAFVQQIEQTGRDPGEIFVAGMDGQNEALELLAADGGPQGIYRASAALILDQLGKAVADLPINIVEGQPANSLLLNYAVITPKDAARAQQILDTYEDFTS